MAKLVYKAMGDTMTNNHLAFLNTFCVMKVNTFSQTADKYFEEAISPMRGPTLFHIPKHQKKTVGGSGAPSANKGGLELHKKQQSPTQWLARIQYNRKRPTIGF